MCLRSKLTIYSFLSSQKWLISTFTMQNLVTFFFFPLQISVLQQNLLIKKKKKQKIQNQGWLLPWGQRGPSPLGWLLQAAPLPQCPSSQSPAPNHECAQARATAGFVSPGVQRALWPRRGLWEAVLERAQNSPKLSFAHKGDWWICFDLCACPSLLPSINNSA